MIAGRIAALCRQMPGEPESEKHLTKLNAAVEGHPNAPNPLNCGSTAYCARAEEVVVAQKSFSPPASVLDKSKARFRRLQNSPAAQTLVIADLTLRQDFFVKLRLRKRS